jgi:surfactin synthase thioesterase subunit
MEADMTKRWKDHTGDIWELVKVVPPDHYYLRHQDSGICADVPAKELDGWTEVDNPKGAA